MALNYINPSIVVNDSNFKVIMDNMINNVSNIFINNRNLVEQNNYNIANEQILIVVSNFLKVYKFYDYPLLLKIDDYVKDINIQIYNSNIEVIIDIKFIISQTFFVYKKRNWEEFFAGFNTKNPFVYDGLDASQKQELRISLVNGNFYMYDNIQIEIDNNGIIILFEGIILKKKLCTCENTVNCNMAYSYIITMFWPKAIL